MKKRITLIIFYTTLISILVSTVGIAFLLSEGRDDEINHSSDLSALPYGIAIMVTIFMAISAGTIFLNVYDKIRTNKNYRLLSFFLLPVFVAVATMILLGNIKESWLFYCLIALPFLLILLFHYIRFTKKYS